MSLHVHITGCLRALQPQSCTHPPHMTWQSCCHVSLHHATAMMTDEVMLLGGHLIVAGRRGPGKHTLCTHWPLHGSIWTETPSADAVTMRILTLLASWNLG